MAAIDSATRVLRLPTIRSRFEEIATSMPFPTDPPRWPRRRRTARATDLLGFLAELVMAECDERDKRRAARRIRAAGFSRDKRIEEFDFTVNPSVNPAVIHQLATCAWVKAGHPLCLIGDSGTENRTCSSARAPRRCRGGLVMPKSCGGRCHGDLALNALLAVWEDQQEHPDPSAQYAMPTRFANVCGFQYASHMSLPTAYLTSAKNTGDILKSMQSAQAPERFTTKFLEGLGYPSSNDRAMINVLKALGFLTDSGVPSSRYHQYMDQTQSDLILAQAIREAYADLFRVNRSAQTMTQNDVKQKMKTLSEGQFSDRVLAQMASTFTTLSKLADWSATPAREQTPDVPAAGDHSADQQLACVGSSGSP